MRIKNNILIFDTETVGNFGSPLVHDIAYIILDKNSNTLVERNFLVSSVRNAQWLLNSSQFYRSKAHLYSAILECGIPTLHWNEIEDIILSDLSKHKVHTVCAYNLAFDFRALRFTSQFLNGGSTKLIDKIQSKRLLCLWFLACETILTTPHFADWCEHHNQLDDSNTYISKNGNLSTNAEITYQFITGNPDFREDHTALSDTRIEVEIYKHIRTTSSFKALYGLKYGCWRRPQRKP